MKQEISTERIPIKLWLDDLEEIALGQAKNLANLPFAFRHIAIMPDSHVGYGMPIGGVLTTENVIIPNAVDVDIGCGMVAVRTPAIDISDEKLRKILEDIQKRIPIGFNWHKKSQDESLIPEPLSGKSWIVNAHRKKALEQVGTLGRGNHFIEIQKGSDGFFWIMIHSGSRNIGKQVADFYNNKARELAGKFSYKIPKEWELDYLPLSTDQAERYITEMNFCIEYAYANRKLMMDRALEIFKEITGVENGYGEIINKPHNFAAEEIHFGKKVLVHRKGATKARAGEIGMIPGSQGTKSFIVEGLGNAESFESCSHGSGRKMGRKEAERTLSFKEEIEDLDKKGVIHAIRSKKDLDEAPSAYKDIEVVMKNQEDLVKIVVELTPKAVIKG